LCDGSPQKSYPLISPPLNSWEPEASCKATSLPTTLRALGSRELAGLSCEEVGVAQLSYLTEQQVSEILSVSIRTLQGWRYYKRGPAYLKIGRLVRYRPEEVARFAEQYGVVTTESV
jgi:hypothetical protein